MKDRKDLRTQQQEKMDELGVCVARRNEVVEHMKATRRTLDSFQRVYEKVNDKIDEIHRDLDRLSQGVEA